MKAPTFIIMTSVILALTASAAQANLDRMLPPKHALAVQHKAVTHKKIAAHKVTKHVSTGPLYIHIPGPAGQPSVYADDCLTSGNNCTDQQLCDTWGMNCEYLGSMAATPPAESAPAAASPSPVQSAPAPVDNIASTTPAMIDNSGQCWSGTVWDEDHQYCA